MLLNRKKIGFLIVLLLTLFFGNVTACNNGKQNCHREVQKDVDVTRSLEIACALNPSDRNLCNIALIQATIPYQCFSPH
ncbi:hypothetical protein LEP1GSC047_3646 [Leptospira inadai serovar Lyme str. 10]|uniref:Lipoprotein n=2 Tax=Leptospira inadai serovar Lyme TaxID=293084 RepID=V6HLN8_9LEPT|nr:hypothetical protein [Leptospira inadai]EQA37800.1 hypothetical protein LEP1GSC047_3646 [Leptospira inadai serovar Lyme str. 10]PNV75000.1 hypothetical protein BES34_010535 [Leptospira inadai serovar Lyme]